MCSFSQHCQVELLLKYLANTKITQFVRYSPVIICRLSLFGKNINLPLGFA